MAITSFRGSYAFLSNFSPAPITYEGITYPTTEHFYHAMKTVDINDRKMIAALPSPAAAKKAGYKLKIRPDWEQVKVEIMAAALQAKFQYPELREKLLATGNEQLVEGNVWHDNFWGNCSCPKCWNTPGLNHLGKLLMAVRTVLQQEKS